MGSGCRIHMENGRDKGIRGALVGGADRDAGEVKQ